MSKAGSPTDLDCGARISRFGRSFSYLSGRGHIAIFDHPPPLTLGTRGSPLALDQAEAGPAPSLALPTGSSTDAIAIEVIKTSGDIILDRPLSEVGGKGLFTKEIEHALDKGGIDLAVHSAKDVATTIPDGIRLCPPSAARRRARRLLVADRQEPRPFARRRQDRHLLASARRADEALPPRFPHRRVPRQRPDAAAKARRRGCRCHLLALAGLNRLDQAHSVTPILDLAHFPPAPAQGAIVIEARADDEAAIRLAQVLDDGDTRACVEAERAFLKVLDGSCRTPIAALATLSEGKISLLGQILSPDGADAFEDQVSGDADAGHALGKMLGEKLIADAGDDFIARFHAG